MHTGQFSQEVLKDDSLLRDPDMLSKDGSLGWQSAMWYWTTQGPHQALVEGRGFGGTIKAINGAIECGKGSSPQVEARVARFTRICQEMGIDPGSNLRC